MPKPMRKPAVSSSAERLLQARLPADLVKALRIHALERETTVKDLVTQLVRDYLKREGYLAGRKS